MALPSRQVIALLRRRGGEARELTRLAGVDKQGCAGSSEFDPTMDNHRVDHVVDLALDAQVEPQQLVSRLRAKGRKNSSGLNW